MTIVLIAFACLLACMATWDLLQKKHAILRNFPIIGHFRYWLELIGPELRQYIVTSNNEERPFSRDQRRWVYASSKKNNNYFAFGTDNDLENSPNFLIIKQSAFPLEEPKPGDDNFDPLHQIKAATKMGRARNRAHAFQPESIINLSAMSYGSLSGPAIEAINRGCQLSKCLQNTGEGGVSKYHKNGGNLVLQIGTGYFGCRNEKGKFELSQLKDLVASNPIRAIELKLSQGAKPGRGGVLPADKITPEIAEIRGIPMGQDCISPSGHTAFRDVDSMLDFVEMLGTETGLPIGIKSAVGQMDFWNELTEQMATTERGVDFITIDGGEGGTGAAPLVFSDHVSMPFKIGFSRVYSIFQKWSLQNDVVFIGSGKLGFPATSLLAFALGCDMINVAREGMLAIGCIQAQKCHTGHCPAGVATQNKWLMRGLDPTYKAARLANYVVTLRKEIMQLCRVCGIQHPSLITSEHFEVLRSDYRAMLLKERFQSCSNQPSPALVNLDENHSLRSDSTFTVGS